MINFREDLCQGCELCVETCPKKLLELDKSRVNKRGHNPVQITDKEKCNDCSLCAIMCPDCVIELSS